MRSALLLVAGWLLMSPPLVKDTKAPGGFRVDSAAKVEDWKQLSAHDTATDCERARSAKAVDMISSAEEFTNRKDVLGDPRVGALLQALCVPADYVYPLPGADSGECTMNPAAL